MAVKLGMKFDLDPKVVADLPEKALCSGCGADLITLAKEVVVQRAHIQVHFTKPPKVTDVAKAIGEATCDKCGAKTPIDLRFFGATRAAIN